MKTKLTLTETREMLRQVARGMISSQAMLTEADRATGDGDHGVAMGRGFEAVLAALDDQEAADLKDLFFMSGTALITAAGGASGIIFGSWFSVGGMALAGRQEFDSQALFLFLQDGLKAVQKRGRAQAGDKSMVDALLPALTALEGHTSDGLAEALRLSAQAAKVGAESTKEMDARTGKARSLGPRALGFVDPGALSTSLILEFMQWYVEGLP